MPVLLFGVGAFALVMGLAMVGYGIPINEFSFGNTLIGAGTTAIVGGLIIIALGVTVLQLRRIAEALSMRPLGQIGQPDAFENLAGARPIPGQSRVPFPSRPKPEPHAPATITPAPAGIPIEDRPAPSFAPTLRNPDEPPVTVEDDISLSPHQPLTGTAPADAETGGAPRPAAPPLFGSNGSGAPDKSQESMPGWRPSAPTAPPRTPPAANFDAMWPAEAKPAKVPPAVKPETKLDLPPREPVDTAPQPAEPEEQKPRAVAILKSGVVDGMGYTLYVDGSIEAELPQGTLRFASINELRSHLEKNA